MRRGGHSGGRAHTQGLYSPPAWPGRQRLRLRLPALDPHGCHQFGLLKVRGAEGQALERCTHNHGTRPVTFAQTSSLMHLHALGNPIARYRQACNMDQVTASPMVSDPLHLLEICAVSDGAAALQLGSKQQALKRVGHAGGAWPAARCPPASWAARPPTFPQRPWPWPQSPRTPARSPGRCSAPRLKSV